MEEKVCFYLISSYIKYNLFLFRKFVLSDHFGVTRCPLSYSFDTHKHSDHKLKFLPLPLDIDSFISSPPSDNIFASTSLGVCVCQTTQTRQTHLFKEKNFFTWQFNLLVKKKKKKVAASMWDKQNIRIRYDNSINISLFALALANCVHRILWHYSLNYLRTLTNAHTRTSATMTSCAWYNWIDCK